MRLIVLALVPGVALGLAMLGLVDPGKTADVRSGWRQGQSDPSDWTWR